MKKILSLFIAVIMVASIASTLVVTSAATPVYADDAVHTLDAHNVAINVPYFSGYVYYSFLHGNASGNTVANGKIQGEAVDFDMPINNEDKENENKRLILDGIITEEEWGLPIADINRDYAATLGGTETSAENTYYWRISDKDIKGLKDAQKQKLNKVYSEDFGYKVWMAWDKEYLYIAVEVKDPDGHSASMPKADANNDPNPLSTIWDGDALQFIIDPEGPNSVTRGENYKGEYNVYRADKSDTRRPWNSLKAAQKKGEGTTAGDGKEILSKVYLGKAANIGVNFNTAPTLRGVEDGHTSIYDMARRYNPTVGAVNDAQGNIDYYSVNWTGYDIDYKRFELTPTDDTYATNYNPLLAESEYFAWAACRPVSVAFEQVEAGASMSSISNKNAYRTSYEVAIPWTLVSGSYIDYNDPHEIHIVDPDVKAGDEYGFSLAVLNSYSGAFAFDQTYANSWLTWGSGICNAQENGTDFLTAGGSNSLVLVSDELGTIGCDHTFAPPTCSTPYKCTKCGYEKGFPVGHYFKSEVTTPLASNKNGVIVSTCQYCGMQKETTIETGDADKVVKFNSNPTTQIKNGVEVIDLFQANALKEGQRDNLMWVYSDNAGDTSGFSHIYRPLTQDFEKNKDGTFSKWLTWSDGTPKMIEDTNQSGIVDPDPALNGRTKASYRPGEDGKMYFDFGDTFAGTYFSTTENLSTFSYKYDMRLTGDEFSIANYGSEEDSQYAAGIYHVFGGMNPGNGTVSYGLNYCAGFFPKELGSTVGTFKILDANTTVSKDTEYKVLAESEEIDLGTGWHEVVFVYDSNEGAAMYYLDGECIMGAWDEGMAIGHNDQVAIIRRIDVPFEMKGMEVAKGSTSVLLAADENVVSGYKVTCDGEVIGEYEAGETVELPVPANKKEGFERRFYTWVGGDVEITRSRYDESIDNALHRTLTMVMPGNDVTFTSDFFIIGDIDGDNSITSKDVASIKEELAGSPSGRMFAICDVDGDGSVVAPDLALMKTMLAS